MKRVLALCVVLAATLAVTAAARADSGTTVTVMTRNVYFGADLFSELDRLQRQMSSLFGGFPSSLRSSQSGTFPHINIGTTDDTIEIVAFDEGLARESREAFIRFGKGRHFAGLNFGDCVSYALAQTRGLPLLYKGDDFAKTDVIGAL